MKSPLWDKLEKHSTKPQVRGPDDSRIVSPAVSSDHEVNEPPKCTRHAIGEFCSSFFRRSHWLRILTGLLNVRTDGWNEQGRVVRGRTRELLQRQLVEKSLAYLKTDKARENHTANRTIIAVLNPVSGLPNLAQGPVSN